MREIGAIALNTFREAVRDRVLYNLFIFALLLMGTAILFGEISIGVQELILVNLGLSAMTFFGLAIAIFIGIGLVYKEIDKRTLYAILSKPVKRHQFLLGKFCGLAFTLLVNILLMSIGFFLALYYVRRSFQVSDVNLLAAIYFIFLTLLLTTALAMLFSTFSSPVLSAAFTLGLFIAGSFSTDLRDLSEALEAPWLAWLMDIVYYAIPNFKNFNIITGAAHGQPAPPGLLWFSTLYAIVYGGLVLTATMLIFQKRDLR